MTQQHPTSSANAPKTAEEVPAQKDRTLQGFIGLLFFGVLIGGGIWAAQNEKIPGFPKKPVPDVVHTSAYQPNAPTKIKEEPSVSPNVEVAELLALQEQAKRVRLALRKDINALEAQFAEITQRLDSLQSTVENLQNNAITSTANAEAPGNAAMQADLTALNEKIAALQQDYETRSHRYVTQLQINQLLDAIAVRLREGESYAADMRQLMLLAGDSGLNEDALNNLAMHADEGAPSLAKLIDSFDEAAQTAVPASLAAKENPNFSDEVRGHLSRVVTIRRIEADATDDSDEAQIIRAETELHMGNVDMALTHLAQLSDATREIFAPWVSEAEAYLAAQDALAQLKNALTQTRAE